MAPVAAVSRPPGRPKLRSKIDGRPAISALCTARNLDRCTRQLGHWNPFANSAAASPDHKFGSKSLREEGQLPEPNPNLGSGTVCYDNHHRMLAAESSNVLVRPECWRFPGTVQHSTESRGSEPFPSFGESWFYSATISGIEKGVFEFGKVPSEYGARSVHEGRVHGWSKRRKQLSHALARGLWRWKDGFHARKRMKRCGPGGSRNSGSDKSSDRAPHAVHASDPSTAPTSKAGPFKWSDFPVTPTDSSGELFSCTGGGSGSNLVSEMNALGKDWTACSCLREDGINGRADCDQCWLGNDNQNTESGYGSEPGYRGDEEPEFGDIDDQDEEEIEPEHLRQVVSVLILLAPHDKHAPTDARCHAIVQDRSSLKCKGRGWFCMQMQPPPLVVIIYWLVTSIS
ncbi:uncharacterized protein [Physcomitrium patens]|uniref:uncharacterized protein isoform X3 n=1 Tax=Physcomitrium patens TaxID=3218 RepID=UPI000D179C85|nr:uncharacterized protein LOC112291609 isoform X3 [Physcomitrium patens]|eukprot:XP_024395033.1 uncharacterized protein LOC112291609 isoform X3 [Physcomitrella patens]